MERTEQRNVDDPNVSWEDLALSEIDGQANFYKVASVGEVQARHLLEALAEDRRTARSPDSRQYRSVLSLVNVPGWGDRTVLNMIAANWVFQPYTSDGEAPAIDPKVPEPNQTLMVQYDQAKENSFAWFIHE